MTVRGVGRAAALAVAAGALVLAAGATAAPPTITVVTPAEIVGGPDLVVRVDATVPGPFGTLAINTSADAPCDPRGAGGTAESRAPGAVSVTRSVPLSRPGLVRVCASVLASGAPPPGEVAEIAVTARAERAPVVGLALLAAPTTTGDYAIRLTASAERTKTIGFLLTRVGACPAAWPPQRTDEEKAAARIAYPGMRIRGLRDGGPLAEDLTGVISTPGPTLACAYAFPPGGFESGPVLATAALPFEVTGKALTTLTTTVRKLGTTAAIVRARVITGRTDGGLFGRTPPGRCRFVPDNRPVFGPPEKTISAPVKRLYGPKYELRSEGVCDAKLDRGTGRPRPWRVRFVPSDPAWTAPSRVVTVAPIRRR